MYGGNRLEKIVATEVKRRKYIINTLLLISLFYLAANLVFNDTGLIRYLHLKKTEKNLNMDLYKVNAENAKLKSTIEQYKSNNYYVEKHARENFGLAGEDEIIFVYKDKK